MPSKVALKVAAGVAAGVAASAFAAYLIWRLSPIAAGLFIIVVLQAGIYAAFVYYPKFDPTGATLWKGPRAGKRIAITFDDGPSRFTGPILDVLAKKGVKATFFFLGENAGRHQAAVQRARREGHAIGNHGADHARMHRMSESAIAREITDGEAAIGKVSSVGNLKMMRTPHGFKSHRVITVLRKLGYVLVAWTDGVWDSDRPGADVIVERSKKAARPGAILLLHDGDGTNVSPDREQTIQALPEIIDYYLGNGFALVTIPEMFSGRGEA